MAESMIGFRWYGSKHRLAPSLVRLLPPHEVYVEPFGGSAAVLLHKQRSRFEVFNDMDRQVVNFFEVVRNHTPDLQRLIELTPYHECESDLDLLDPLDDPLEAARRFCAKSFMRRGAMYDPNGDTFKYSLSCGCVSKTFARLPSNFEAIARRLRGVLFHCKDAIEVIDMYDRPDVAMYIDPPYPHEVRKKKKGYMSELDTNAHALLIERLKVAKCKWVLSTYHNEHYSDLLKGYPQHAFQARTTSGTSTELVYTNFEEISLFRTP